MRELMIHQPGIGRGIGCETASGPACGSRDRPVELDSRRIRPSLEDAPQLADALQLPTKLTAMVEIISSK